MSWIWTKPTGPRPSRVPPLQAGDRLSRAEFERRSDATPGLKTAELIDWGVHAPPPVSPAHHSRPCADFLAWIGFDRAMTPCVLSGDNGSLRLDPDDMPQSDAYMLSPEHAAFMDRLRSRS